MRDHPLESSWDTGFEPRTDTDHLDVMTRALRGMVIKHRPVRVRPVSLDAAKRFISYVHSHAPSLTGWKYGLSLWDEVGMIGVIAVGRPTARLLDDGQVLEITRCALMDNTPPNSASMLYGRACRMAAAQGVPKIITYTLEEEDGTSLRAAGFVPVARSEGGSRSRPSRLREDEDHDLGPKIRWERVLNKEQRRDTCGRPS